MVCATTRRPGQTRSFVLHPGDHPAIKADSILSYASLQLLNMEKLARAYRATPKLVWSERKSDDVHIRQIQQALIDSGMLEPRYEKLIAKAQERFAD